MAKTKKKLIRFKKLNFRKNWKKLSYLGLSGLLLLTSFSYGGWKIFEQHNAQAAGMTPLPGVSRWPVKVVYGCRQTYSTAYGLMHKVTFTGTRTYSSSATANYLNARVTPKNSGQILRSTNGYFNSRGVAGVSVFVSAQLGEEVEVMVSGTDGGTNTMFSYRPAGYSNVFNPYALTTC